MDEKKIKILLLADDKSANTRAWTKNLIKHGCEIRIVSTRAIENYENVISLGMNFLPPRLKFLLLTNKVKQIIEEEKPDIIIGYRVTSYGYLAAKTGFRPLIIAAQNEQIVRLPMYAFTIEFLLKFCVRYALKKADLIHAWGENIKNGLLRFGADPKRILVMHRGIDLKIFHPPTEKHFSANKVPVIISTRSLYPEYKVDKLIKAFACVVKKYPNAILKIAGDGPERPKLFQLGSTLGIRDNLIFYKSLDPQYLAEQLRSADIYVSLIQTEGISSSLIEACACGLLPIVADMPASREVVGNGKNAVFLSSRSPSDIAETILNAYEDLELRKNAFKINPSITRDKFDADKNIAKFIAEYRRIIFEKSISSTRQI